MCLSSVHPGLLLEVCLAPRLAPPRARRPGLGVLPQAPFLLPLGDLLLFVLSRARRFSLVRIRLHLGPLFLVHLSVLLLVLLRSRLAPFRPLAPNRHVPAWGHPPLLLYHILPPPWFLLGAVFVVGARALGVALIVGHLP